MLKKIRYKLRRYFINKKLAVSYADTDTYKYLCVILRQIKNDNGFEILDSNITYISKTLKEVMLMQLKKQVG